MLCTRKRKVVAPGQSISNGRTAKCDVITKPFERALHGQSMFWEIEVVVAATKTSPLIRTCDCVSIQGVLLVT